MASPTTSANCVAALVAREGIADFRRAGARSPARHRLAVADWPHLGDEALAGSALRSAATTSSRLGAGRLRGQGPADYADSREPTGHRCGSGGVLGSYARDCRGSAKEGQTEDCAPVDGQAAVKLVTLYQ